MESFIFDGQASSDFGLLISDKDIYSAPARDVSFVSVPGRNGDVIIDNNRYENINVSYTVSFRHLSTRSTVLKLWLCKSGYYCLTDTYQPEYFRMAAFSSNLKIDELIRNVGKAQLVFNCKPFMYSFAGQEKITLTAEGIITNPEAFTSEPYIKITGSGNVTLSIGNKSYSMTAIGPCIELDSELMAAYRGSTLCNNKINFTEFPTLLPGDNNISWTGSVAKVEIVPRWRTL